MARAKGFVAAFHPHGANPLLRAGLVRFCVAQPFGYSGRPSVVLGAGVVPRQRTLLYQMHVQSDINMTSAQFFVAGLNNCQQATVFTHQHMLFTEHIVASMTCCIWLWTQGNMASDAMLPPSPGLQHIKRLTVFLKTCTKSRFGSTHNSHQLSHLTHANPLCRESDNGVRGAQHKV